MLLRYWTTVCLVLLFRSSPFAQITSYWEGDSILYQNIPHWARMAMDNSELMKGYVLLDDLNPFYLEADFNSDEQSDIVFNVKNRLENKIGFAIINRGTNNIFIVGAGNDIGMGTDASWCKRWFIYRDNWVYNFSDKKKYSLREPRVEIVKSNSTSSVIYWDKRRYNIYIKHI